MTRIEIITDVAFIEDSYTTIKLNMESVKEFWEEKLETNNNYFFASREQVSMLNDKLDIALKNFEFLMDETFWAKETISSE